MKLLMSAGTQVKAPPIPLIPSFLAPCTPISCNNLLAVASTYLFSGLICPAPQRSLLFVVPAYPGRGRTPAPGAPPPQAYPYKVPLRTPTGVLTMAMCMSPNLSTGVPSQHPTKPTDLTTMCCLLLAQEHASQEEKATSVKISDFQGEDESASETCDDIRLPVLHNLEDVQEGLTDLMATQSPIDDSDGSGAEPLLILGVSRHSPKRSFDDPAWLLGSISDGCRWTPSERHCKSHSVIPQPSTFFDSEPLSQIDNALISGDVHEYHCPKRVVPRQSSHLRKAERKLFAPFSMLPHASSVAKIGAHAKHVHQDAQPLLIVGLPLCTSCMEFTPISGQTESVPEVQQHDPAYDPSSELSGIYLDRAYMRLSAIRAGASSQQYRGSTTWHDFMLRSQQMPRTAHSGLRHFSGADGSGAPSPSSAAGPARRRQEHSWYGTILHSKAAAAAHGRG
eukprot:gene20945-27795_t